MLIPSIDLQAGHAVQLIGGAELAIDAGDPRPIAGRFGRLGEIAVIDLDAALGKGSNRPVIEELVKTAACRVGGGIRDVDHAVRWLDAGAHKIILGTAARPDILEQLPKERVIAALDARNGEVVVDGWQTATGKRVLEQIAALRAYVGGIMVTFVEREGRLQGTDLAFAKEIVEAAGPACAVTIAGGVTTAEEIRDLDAIGADAQVGMALYSGRLDLTDAFAAPLNSDRPDGLFATIVCDRNGQALGLAWSSQASLRQVIDTGKGVYQSRTRGLWHKGASSGATQYVHRIDVDCDRDCLRFTVDQAPPGYCHLHTWTCFGADAGLVALERRLQRRLADAPAGSYSARLFNDRDLLDAKLREECAELIAAEAKGDIVHEAADVLFFTLCRLVADGVPLHEIGAELDRRALKVTRRD